MVAYQDEKAARRAAGLPKPPEDKRRPDPPDGFNIIGQRVPLLDARCKVTGQTVYCDDIQLPGMLICKIWRSPWAYARIDSIDTSKAEALPGVHGVMVGTELPIKFGVLPISQDETALAVDKVRHLGEGVVAVAADTEAIANAALELVDVQVTELPAFLKKQDSVRDLREGEEKIHEHIRFENNIHKRVKQSFGGPEEAFAAADYVAEGSFEFKAVTHAFTEPIAAIAHWTPDQRMVLWTSQQVPHYTHKAVAKVLELPMHQIRVIKPAVGGGFGGKSDPFPHEMVVCHLARKIGRPIKMLFDREEVFFSNHGRHPTATTAKMALGKDGNIKALEIDALIDGGAFGSFGVVTSYYNGVLSHGPYRLPAFKYQGTRVYSNRPVSGAMRGHGSVNSRMCTEVLLDELCEQAGLDPIDTRLQNVLPEFSTLINGFRITSNGMKECIETVARKSDFKAKYRKLPPGRGIGIGCGFYISGSALQIHANRLPHSTVHLKVDMDGGVTVHTGAADIGQGSDTMTAQCVAEVLGLPMSMFRVYAVDTDMSPIDLGSYSSRVTFMNGLAAKRAGEALREKLIAAAAKISGYAPKSFDMREGWVYNRHWPEASVKYEEALEEALAGKGALTVSGSYTSPPMGVTTYKGAGAGLSPTYSYTSYVCELEVDTDTGFIQPIKVWAAHDCGRALNPLSVEGQIEGSIHMGLGQVLCEEMDYNGPNLLNANFLDYRMPTSSQMPELDVTLVESIDPEGPFGAKECGEGGLAPILPAVANAVYDAVGVRVRKLPLTPDVVLAAIERKARADRKAAKAAGSA
ncbi:MAG: molybdopterin-dependent oxidoreductase [Proteobacteria bacterium]|nr:molybdopterin-dependent oxidoreductase [Pseudomonadota bacterium]